MLGGSWRRAARTGAARRAFPSRFILGAATYGNSVQGGSVQGAFWHGFAARQPKVLLRTAMLSVARFPNTRSGCGGSWSGGDRQSDARRVVARQGAERRGCSGDSSNAARSAGLWPRRRRFDSGSPDFGAWLRVPWPYSAWYGSAELAHARQGFPRRLIRAWYGMARPCDACRGHVWCGLAMMRRCRAWFPFESISWLGGAGYCAACSGTAEPG